MDNELLKSNNFFVGVNYWASNAGIKMWSNFDIKVIENDFKKLKNIGVKVLRVFPIWSEFQPVKRVLGYKGSSKEIRISDDYSKPLTKEEESGIDIKCINELNDFIDLAKKYELKLIVSLMTGWMSGRNFYPEAFVNQNPIMNSEVIEWEVKFVNYIVANFKNKQNIIAWELGNECNCFAPSDNPSDAWLWTNTIVSAIKLNDNTRPVISGMHSLYADGNNFDIKNQSELCDVLTIHPYMLFTPYCDLEQIISPRAITHTACELSYYRDLGKKPCLVEEIGSLNPTFGDDETTAKFIRANLFNAWAYDGLGFLWWTAFDQDKYFYAPYEFSDLERELGIFKSDDKPKKQSAEEMKKFADFIDKFPYKELPSRKVDALCLVPSDDWINTFGAFMLSNRAGIDVEFGDINDHLKDSKLYIVPGAPSSFFMKRDIFEELLKKIENGATALFTNNGGLYTYFEKLMGCNSKGRRWSTCPVNFEIDGEKITLNRVSEIDLEPTTAKVLLKGDNGKPLMTVNNYGKGKVLFFDGSLERTFVTEKSSSLSENGLEKVYEIAFKQAKLSKPVYKKNKFTTLTIHPIDKESDIVIYANNGVKDVDEVLSIDKKYAIEEVYYGKVDKKTAKVKVPSGDAVVFKIKKA